jgi:hypothetical protein
MWWVVLSVIAGALGLSYSRVKTKRQHKSHAVMLTAAKLRHEDLLSEFNYELYRFVKDTPGATEFIDELKTLSTEISHLSTHHATIGRLGNEEKHQVLSDWHRFSDHVIAAISPAVNDYPIINFQSWRMEVAAEGIVLKQRLTEMLPG